MATREGSVITAEMTKIAETWVSEAWTDTIERGRIRDWADCIGDPNPLYRDVEYARRLGYRDIPAPPSYLYSYNPYYHGTTNPIPRPFKNGFSASDETITLRPIVAGDTIKATVRVAEMWEKQGRSHIGRMLFVKHEYTYTNQDGEVVGRGYWISVGFEGPTAQEAKEKEAKENMNA